MIRIAHLAYYGTNVGDNIAIHNVRRGLEKVTKDRIYWKTVHLEDFHNNRNSIKYSLKRFSSICKENELLLIGGGGLIEGNNGRYETGWKLPFNEKILKAIKIPIICYALGINYFWDRPTLEDCSDLLKRLIDKSEIFSFRHDGSLEIAEQLLGKTKAVSSPDPGILVTEVPMKSIEQMKQGAFQVAFNAKDKINISRFRNLKNLESLVCFVNSKNLIGIPHTLKDLSFPLNRWTQETYTEEDFSYDNFMKIVDSYDQFDYMLCMRGHGQIVSFHKNIPGIYLATQPKIIGFSEHSGLMDYTVDIRSSNWLEILINKIDKLTKDQNYLNEWYNIRNKKRQERLIQFKDFNKKIAKLLLN